MKWWVLLVKLGLAKVMMTATYTHCVQTMETPCGTLLTGHDALLCKHL